MREFQQKGLSSNDSRYTQWVIGAVQARVVLEAARLQEKTGQDLANSTSALVSATNRLGIFTAALVVVAIVEVLTSLFR